MRCRCDVTRCESAVNRSGCWFESNPGSFDLRRRHRLREIDPNVSCTGPPFAPTVVAASPVPKPGSARRRRTPAADRGLPGLVTAREAHDPPSLSRTSFLGVRLAGSRPEATVAPRVAPFRFVDIRLRRPLVFLGKRSEGAVGMTTYHEHDAGNGRRTRWIVLGVAALAIIAAAIIVFAVTSGGGGSGGVY